MAASPPSPPSPAPPSLLLRSEPSTPARQRSLPARRPPGRSELAHPLLGFNFGRACRPLPPYLPTTRKVQARPSFARFQLRSCLQTAPLLLQLAPSPDLLCLGPSRHSHLASSPYCSSGEALSFLSYSFPYQHQILTVVYMYVFV
jgi:hypothetical protein